MTEKPGGRKAQIFSKVGFFASRLARLSTKDWCRASFIALLAILVHAPALSGELIWDDIYLAHDNPFIKSPLLILETFRHYLFLDSYSAHYRPVQNLSLIFDYFFWNDNTYGFHLTNILLHAASGVLLYFLLRRLLRSLVIESLGSLVASSAAFLIALVWVVHPVHSAAIDYISGRADCLAFLFAAGAWLLFLRAQETVSTTTRLVFYTLASSSALLALCSRETACIWLAIFAVYTLVFRQGLPPRHKAAVLCACVVLFALYVGLRHLPGARPGPGPNSGWSGAVRTTLMFRALGDYGSLLVFPSNLHMERTVLFPTTYVNSDSWKNSAAFEYLSLLGLLVAAALAFGCGWQSPYRRLRVFGAVWFLIGFLPVSNLVELNATVAEHWLYLPSVGLLLFLTGVALDLPHSTRPVLIGCTAVAVVALSLRAAERSSDWITAERFYERTIAAGGTSVRVSLNLGQIYATRGEYGRAEKLLRQILVTTPDYPIAKANLANVLFREGKKQEAEALFASAAATAPLERKDYPRTWLAAVNLAGIHEQKHETKQALEILEQTRSEYPDIWEIVSLECEILRKQNRPTTALKLAAAFARDHWWHYSASLALGRLYAVEGDAERAVVALQHASRLDVHEVDALNLIARIRVRQNRLAEAYRTQKRAIARQPDAPRQYMLLSDILEKMGQRDEAKDVIAKVARLQAIGPDVRAVAN